MCSIFFIPLNLPADPYYVSGQKLPHSRPANLYKICELVNVIVTYTFSLFLFSVDPLVLYTAVKERGGYGQVR
jgi:hypothetical protein